MRTCDTELSYTCHLYFWAVFQKLKEVAKSSSLFTRYFNTNYDKETSMYSTVLALEV